MLRSMKLILYACIKVREDNVERSFWENATSGIQRRFLFYSGIMENANGDKVVDIVIPWIQGNQFHYQEARKTKWRNQNVVENKSASSSCDKPSTSSAFRRLIQSSSSSSSSPTKLALEEAALSKSSKQNGRSCSARGIADTSGWRDHYEDNLANLSVIILS